MGRIGRPPRFTPEEDAALAERYSDGESIVDLAREMGARNPTITRALERQGVKVRTKREGQIVAAARRQAQGLRHPNYRGKRVKVAGDYRGVSITPDDPMWEMAYDRRRLKDYDANGYVLEHRLVMARSLGRPLTPTETVHHRNGKRDDNRLENLQLRNGKHGKGQAFRCCDCGSTNVEAIKL